MDLMKDFFAVLAKFNFALANQKGLEKDKRPGEQKDKRREHQITAKEKIRLSVSGDRISPHRRLWSIGKGKTIH